MRRNYATGEPVLEMDHAGRRKAQREIAEQWDPDALRRWQEAWVSQLCPVVPGDWVTASRDDKGVVRFWSEDF